MINCYFLVFSFFFKSSWPTNLNNTFTHSVNNFLNMNHRFFFSYISIIHFLYKIFLQSFVLQMTQSLIQSTYMFFEFEEVFIHMFLFFFLESLWQFQCFCEECKLNICVQSQPVLPLLRIRSVKREIIILRNQTLVT